MRLFSAQFGLVMSTDPGFGKSSLKLYIFLFRYKGNYGRTCYPVCLVTGHYCLSVHYCVWHCGAGPGLLSDVAAGAYTLLGYFIPTVFRNAGRSQLRGHRRNSLRKLHWRNGCIVALQRLPGHSKNSFRLDSEGIFHVVHECSPSQSCNCCIQQSLRGRQPTIPNILEVSGVYGNARV